MTERLCRSALFAAVLLVSAWGALHAQEGEELTAAADAVLERMDQLEALTAIQESLARVTEEIVATERELTLVGTEEERQAVEQALVDLHQRAVGLEEDFTHIATGIDFTLFEQVEEEDFDLRQALTEIFEPVALEMRTAAARPREVEKLRAEVSLLERRIPEIELQEIAESGLRFNVIGKFAGGAASEYTEIGWLLNQAALAACNRYGWEIPYPQLTVRRPTES